jgi:hypothetical protein
MLPRYTIITWEFTLGTRVNENAFCKNKAKLISLIYITYLDTKICLDTSILLAVSNMDAREYDFDKKNNHGDFDKINTVMAK